MLGATGEDFFPHMVSNATSLKSGKVAFQTTAGGSIASDVFISSLSLGIFKRFQIGTIPVFYFADEHKYNFNFKYNYFQSDSFRASLGFTHMKFNIGQMTESGFTNPPTSYSINLISLAFNYILPSSTYSFGFEYIRGTSHANNQALIYSYEASDTWSADVIKKLTETMILSIGVGESQTEIAPRDESKSFGLGGSVTMLRPGKFFSSPKLGLHYLTESEKFLILATSSFN